MVLGLALKRFLWFNLQMMSNVKVKRQPWGNKTIIFIQGDDKQDVSDVYYRFWHYSIAGLELGNEGLNWLADNAVQFFTTRKKYVQGITLARLFYLIDNEAERFKGVKGGAMAEAKQFAESEYDNLEYTTGYKAKRGIFNYNGYDNGHGKAENLSDNDA
jgi:hypothetical protein|tara:strand:- start:725 stop:1201 length:477 start_codon:yes stop_codon:yes gene_type:complete